MGYLRKDEGNCIGGSLFVIRDVWGYELNEFSINDSEEVILEPGTVLQIDKILKNENSFLEYTTHFYKESSFLLNDFPRDFVFDLTEVSGLAMMGGGDECDRIYERLVDDGDIETGVKYAVHLMNRIGQKKDFENGFDLVNEGVKKDNPQGLYEMGRCYEFGINVECTSHRGNSACSGRTVRSPPYTGAASGLSRWRRPQWWSPAPCGCSPGFPPDRRRGR